MRNLISFRIQFATISVCFHWCIIEKIAVFSFGSDGTDGPTDAAGGFVDQDSFAALRAAGLDPADILRRNDAYPALERIGGLIHTGPTGTNVNDLAMLLLPRRE